MSSNGDQARLCTMFELAMAASCADQIPAILFEALDRVAHFHYNTLPLWVLLLKNLNRSACHGGPAAFISGSAGIMLRHVGQGDVLHAPQVCDGAGELQDAVVSRAELNGGSRYTRSTDSSGICSRIIRRLSP